VRRPVIQRSFPNNHGRTFGATIMRRPTWQFVWKEELSVGIPEIDAEHKHFIFLVNELNKSITQGMAPEVIKGNLLLILEDAAQHFEHEERLFKEWKYPDADVHAKIHAHVLKVLQEIKEKFIPYGYDSEWVDAGMLIKGVLIDHILTEDMKYADYYQHADNSGKD
jgi:hemerythrin-like metal-binding protein